MAPTGGRFHRANAEVFDLFVLDIMPLAAAGSILQALRQRPFKRPSLL